MLQKLNERIQGFIAWLVIGLIAFTFTLFGVDYYLQSHQSSDVKATVDERVITNQSFENNYRRARAQRDPSKITVSVEKRLRNEVLETMISNEVATASAHDSGFEVNAEQANLTIFNIPQFQEDGQFSNTRFQQALNGALFTPETFQAEVRQGMLLAQQRFAFMGTAFVLPYETDRFVKLYMQTRDYDYLVIPSELFLKNIKITSEEIKQYYEKHRTEFQSPEQVRIEYLQLSMPAIRSKIQLTEEDIKNYYEENQDNFLMPAQWKVAHILFAIPKDASPSTQEEIKSKADDAYKALQENPDQFNHWVKTLSDDKLSIANNGMLPWIVAGQSTLDKTLLQLTEAGQLSEPVKTDHGYELFKLIEYKKANTKPLEEVRDAIKGQLQTEMAQTQYTQLLEQLSDLSYQTPDSLEPAAETLKMPVQSTNFFTSAGGDEPLTKNKAVVNAAFSHDVLNSGNNSEPIQVDNDSVIVLRVNKHIPASIKPLAEVESIISASISKSKASDEARELGKEWINSNPKAKEFITKNNLQWNTVKNASREGDTSDSEINTLAYNITEPNIFKGFDMPNGNYALVSLKEIHPGKIDDVDKEQLSSISQQIEASYGMMDYDLYLNNLIKKAKIVKK